MSPETEAAVRRAVAKYEAEGLPRPPCSPEGLAAARRLWPERFGYPFPEEYAEFAALANGEVDHAFLSFLRVPDPPYDAGRPGDDVLGLNTAMREVWGNELQRFFFADDAAEAYYALRLTDRVVVAVGKGAEADPPFWECPSFDQFLRGAMESVLATTLV